jgi:TetR/AcrR family transcriptional repressor of nem operon
MSERQRQPSNGTRERIIEAARFLFWQKGYTATGLAELLAKARANSGSFYYFFESKDALLRTVLDTYVDLLEPQVIRPAWAALSDPIERVFALLDGYRQRLRDTGCQYGCPIGRLALEVDAENIPAHDRLARNFSAWKDAVEACLRAAGVARPAENATFVLTVMEGAVMQARVYRSLEPFDACVRQLRLHLRAQARSPRPRIVQSKRQRSRT